MDKKKKILLVSNMYPSKKYPHYGVFVQNIFNSLISKKIHVDKCVCTKHSTKLGKLGAYIIFWLFTIYKTLFFEYDVIYVHYASHCALPLLLVHKFKKVKIVTNVHGNDIVPEDNKDEKFLKLSKQLLKISNFVICPSIYFKNILINEFNFNEELIKVIPSGGIDLELFTYNDRSTSNKKILIGFVSRIEKNKGWDVFLMTCRKLVDNNINANFIVVGNGTENQIFLDLIKKLKLENYVTIYNYLSQKDLVNIYKKIDVLCFPTRRKSESLGLVGLESMACGAILVCSNKYGPSSYIENKKNGFSFDPCDVDDCFNSILMAINLDEQSKKILKANALQTVKKYDKEKVKKSLIDFFEEDIFYE